MIQVPLIPCRIILVLAGSERSLLQSADLAVLLTNSTDNQGIGGQVDGVDPIRNPGKFRCAWMSKNYKGAFVHEVGHLFGARDKFFYHIWNFSNEKNHWYFAYTSRVTLYSSLLIM